VTAADGPSGAEPSAWALDKAREIQRCGYDHDADGRCCRNTEDDIALALDAARREGMEAGLTEAERIVDECQESSCGYCAAAIRKAREA